MFKLSLSDGMPEVIDLASKRTIAKSTMEFFQYLKGSLNITLDSASWCGLCMSYLIAFECIRRGEGISITTLSKRADAISFPFTDGAFLKAFQDGVRIGEELLLQGRIEGGEQALRMLKERLG
jgi:hypothetical protein